MFLEGLDMLSVGVIPPDLRSRPPTETEIFCIAPLPFSLFSPRFFAFLPVFVGLGAWGCLPPYASARTLHISRPPCNSLIYKVLRGVVTTPTPKILQLVRICKIFVVIL